MRGAGGTLQSRCMRAALDGWLAAALVSCASAERPPSPALESALPAVSTPAHQVAPVPCEDRGELQPARAPSEPPPGTGVRSLEQLGSIPGIPVEIVWTSELDGRAVDWALRTGAAKAHGVWALLRVVGGWCVLGSFGSSDPVKAPVTLPAPTVVGTGVAVALLRIESLPDEITKLETRYVALATDGRRLWFALEGQGGNQLVAREARLRTRGGKLRTRVRVQPRRRAEVRRDPLHADGLSCTRSLPGGTPRASIGARCRTERRRARGFFRRSRSSS